MSNYQEALPLDAVSGMYAEVHDATTLKLGHSNACTLRKRSLAIATHFVNDAIVLPHLAVNALHIPTFGGCKDTAHPGAAAKLAKYEIPCILLCVHNYIGLNLHTTISPQERAELLGRAGWDSGKHSPSLASVELQSDNRSYVTAVRNAEQQKKQPSPSPTRLHLDDGKAVARSLHRSLQLVKWPAKERIAAAWIDSISPDIKFKSPYPVHHRANDRAGVPAIEPNESCAEQGWTAYLRGLIKEELFANLPGNSRESAEQRQRNLDRMFELASMEEACQRKRDRATIACHDNSGKLTRTLPPAVKESSACAESSSTAPPISACLSSQKRRRSDSASGADGRVKQRKRRSTAQPRTPASSNTKRQTTKLSRRPVEYSNASSPEFDEPTTVTAMSTAALQEFCKNAIRSGKMIHVPEETPLAQHNSSDGDLGGVAPQQQPQLEKSPWSDGALRLPMYHHHAPTSSPSFPGNIEQFHPFPGNDNPTASCEQQGNPWPIFTVVPELAYTQHAQHAQHAQRSRQLQQLPNSPSTAIPANSGMLYLPPNISAMPYPTNGPGVLPSMSAQTSLTGRALISPTVDATPDSTGIPSYYGSGVDFLQHPFQSPQFGHNDFTRYRPIAPKSTSLKAPI
ncbi:uncharacterized protein MYCGRDRAFT_97661 [Zymoseptoria tritici IPO323]|uniref:Uncharacterized protein n=1 Tax=Zymoseptoria tritici (strain CBS 115943 / IPO323) TaxID=336722 RepID=F9XQX3_ZYMTI|nr:uncharacterized protein MYCGRDRAFT_97661 [Zymoseptoria tritici IPO323]EGP82347.1 hypothetical protein MYCGRDRAFT_97661 [Zymoseptoria tritici IPO323]